MSTGCGHWRDFRSVWNEWGSVAEGPRTREPWTGTSLGIGGNLWLRSCPMWGAFWPQGGSLLGLQGRAHVAGWTCRIDREVSSYPNVPAHTSSTQLWRGDGGGVGWNLCASRARVRWKKDISSPSPLKNFKTILRAQRTMGFPPWQEDGQEGPHPEHRNVWEVPNFGPQTVLARGGRDCGWVPNSAVITWSNEVPQETWRKVFLLR